MQKIIISILIAFAALSASAQAPHIEFITPSIVRVQWSADGQIKDNATGVCVYQKQGVRVTGQDSSNELVMHSDELTVTYNKASGNICFADKSGKKLLNQLPAYLNAESVVQERIIYDEKSAHMEETANGKVTVKDIIRRDTIGVSTRYSVAFSSPGEKALYGLGSHMEDYMNLQGKTMYLTQHNLKAMVPMLCSTNGYGLLFDAGCAMKYESQPVNGNTNQYKYIMQLEAAKELDYYFIKGEKLDNVIAGYRYLTGNVSLMPRYVFGYTQSKERYVSSDDILSTLKKYRELHIPIDMIVQDWNYWPEGWGYMKMNRKYYPDPKALADSVHAMNAKLMISIWPNPQWCPEAQDFKDRGMMLEHDVYDVFNPEARKHYWQYANDEFFSQGFDAWWCDSSEPLDGDWNNPPQPENGVPYGWNNHELRWQLNKDMLSEAMGPERSSLYSLYHSMGIYENQRLTTNEKRVLNLTRSSYAGEQRYGTIVWNGDTHASWESFRQQIPSGLNYMATGCPYWTVDVGSFFTNRGKRWFWRGEFPQGVKDDAYKEYYVRMFQWGTFLPILRSHGSDTPREVWQFLTEQEKADGTQIAQGQYTQVLTNYINLRYQLIPYIYSMAAKQSFDSYTMARLLAFDFADDPEVLDIKDEYMFGDILVCPITSPASTPGGNVTRRLYLPKGTKWTNMMTAETYDGGQWINVECTLATMPLFTRAGSIIPTTEVAEYAAAQVGKPLTINVCPGADATFVLYEDEGDNYNFEQGKCSRILLSWDDKKGTLTIGDRQGSYEGMPKEVTINVSVGTKKSTLTYKGKKSVVKL